MMSATTSTVSFKSLSLPLCDFTLPDGNGSAISHPELSHAVVAHDEPPRDNCSLISTTSENSENPTVSHCQNSADISEKKSTSSNGAVSRTVLKLRIKTNNNVVVDSDDQTLAAAACNSQELKQVEPPEKMKKRTFSTFSVSLTREKIEADIIAMGGVSKRMTTRRSNKRTTCVQRKLDDLFPGLRLKSIKPDDNRV